MFRQFLNVNNFHAMDASQKWDTFSKYVNDNYLESGFLDLGKKDHEGKTFIQTAIKAGYAPQELDLFFKTLNPNAPLESYLPLFMDFLAVKITMEKYIERRNYLYQKIIRPYYEKRTDLTPQAKAEYLYYWGLQYDQPFDNIPLLEYLPEQYHIDIVVPNTKGNDKTHVISILHEAIKHKYSSSDDIKSLYERKKNNINLNAQDELGNTPLHLIVDYMFSIHKADMGKILEWLLAQKNIQLDLQNKEGKTPLARALEIAFMIGGKVPNTNVLNALVNPLIRAYLSLDPPNHNPILNSQNTTLINYLLEHHFWAQLRQLIPYMNAAQLDECSRVINQHTSSDQYISLEAKQHYNDYYYKMISSISKDISFFKEQIQDYRDTLGFLDLGKKDRTGKTFLTTAGQLDLSPETLGSFLKQLPPDCPLELYILSFNCLFENKNQEDVIKIKNYLYQSVFIPHYEKRKLAPEEKAIYLFHLALLYKQPLNRIQSFLGDLPAKYKDFIYSLYSPPDILTLHIAINYNRSCDDIRFLYEKTHNKMNLNTQDEKGNTLLHLIAYRLHTTQNKVEMKKTLEWLLDEKSIQLDLQNSEGKTPLACALEARNIAAVNQFIQAYLSLVPPNPNPILDSKNMTLIQYLSKHHHWEQLIQIIPSMNATQLHDCLFIINQRVSSSNLSTGEKDKLQDILDFTSLHLQQTKQADVLNSPDIFFLLISSKIQMHDFKLTSANKKLSSGNLVSSDIFQLYQLCEKGWNEKTDASKEACMQKMKALLLDCLNPNPVFKLATTFFTEDNSKIEQPFYKELLSIVKQCPFSQSQEEKQTTVKVTPTNKF